jgi:arylsulfatase A-like enzyme
MKLNRLSRRDFLAAAGSTVAGIALSGCNSGRGFKRKYAHKPNILFILSDDQSYTALRCAGNLEVKTPNLDRLASGGVHFTHAYNQGSWSGAVCVASRAMLNTGKFLWNAQKAGAVKDHPTYTDPLWAEMMREAGYKTYFSGKWHVRNEPCDVFDVARNVRPGMPADHPDGYNRPIQGRQDNWKPWKEEYGGFWEGGKHWTEVLGDDGVDFLEDAAVSEKLFFMYLAFNAPHDPRQSPKEYVDMYPLEGVSLPESFMGEYPFNEEIGCGRKLRDERLAPFPRTEYSVKVHRQEYYAIITHLDRQIGRILDRLESLGLDDNTVIMFTSDHGLAAGRHGLMGKQNMFEHSMRAPLILSGPGIPENVKAHNLVYLQDVMPTSLELAGSEAIGDVQFKSLLPLIESNFKKISYKYIYGSYKDLQKMITDGRFKLVLYPQAGQTLLFDLKNDPKEMQNLYPQQEYMPTVKILFRQLLKLQTEMADDFDLSVCYPELI